MTTQIARWPAFITVIVLTFTLFTWWSLKQAASGVSPVTDPGYYSHGLKYQGTAIELQTAEARGWTISPQISGRLLTIAVRDDAQSAITGGTAFLTLPTAQVGHGTPPPLALTETAPGAYTATLPAELPATVAASLTLSKDQATIQRQLLIALGQ